MELDPDVCHRALVARDRRFDGVFFVGVATTGIYCRPICPARTPRRDRTAFFASAAEAERAGFRACLRCRPEVAPGRADVDAVPALARRAARLIDAGALNDGDVDALADRLGVTARHLRRALVEALGVTPVELAQTRRLALGKQLLQDSTLGLADVAFAAGFGSVRRFNALFRERFGRAPGEVRRGGAVVSGAAEGANDVRGDGLAPERLPLRLDYRPPLDWPALMAFLAPRAVPGVEAVRDGRYHREVAIGDARGALVARWDEAHTAVVAELDLSLARHAMPIAQRLRALFDLDAHPARVAEVLGADPRLAASVARWPGLRSPGAFEPFEGAVRIVLGQQVSVRAATTLAGRMVARFGPPRPDALAAAPLEALRSIGLTEARARTIGALARAVDGGLDLEDADVPRAMDRLRTVPGIGEWTAEVIAMRVLRWPDAFPVGDLGVRRALAGGGAPDERRPEALRARAEAWRPWRSYAVMHLWTMEASHEDRRRRGRRSEDGQGD